MNEEMVSGLVTSGTISFVAGGCVGYMAKKALKVVAVVAGVGFAGLAALEYYKIAKIDWSVVKSSAVNASHYVYNQAMGIEYHLGAAMNAGTTLAIGSGFFAGVLLGWTRG
jgi:uncharacterized membrane protein (Fun14 family)